MAITTTMFTLLLLPRLIAAAFSPSSDSFISASPSILPSSEPSLPPDIMPAFPSPQKGDAPDGLLPTIPSNLSPPNPDRLDPNSAFAPFGSAASDSVNASFAAPPPAMSRLIFCLGAMWWLVFS